VRRVAAVFQKWVDRVDEDMMLQLNGFSLFELLITLAIIGIVTLVALPAYTEHITHEHRIEAEIALENLAASFEQYNTLHGTYQNATLQSLGSPEYVSKNTYQLNIRTATDTDFLLNAVPCNEQADKDKPCGTLTLNSKGEKGITGQGNVSDCW
jgi:type IV pilus assembly protein PilE